MDQLIDTTDGETLLAAAQQLADFKLDTAYVTFPHQYQNADYYLIFMSQLLGMHSDEQAVLNSQRHTEALYHVYGALTDDYTFLYQVVNNGNGGAYYREQTTGENLFYIHLKRRSLRFNSSAFTNLFINKLLLKGTGVDQINTVLATLIKFGFAHKMILALTSTLIFWTLLTRLKRTGRLIPDRAIVDKLFVSAAKNEHMLRNSQQGHGAQIELRAGLTVDIFDAAEAGGSQQWVLTVHDPDQAVSWFDVLLHLGSCVIGT